MQCIPIRKAGAPDYDLFVILEGENVKRLKAYDPGEVDLLNLGAPWSGLRLRKIVLAYASQEESKRIPGMIRDGRAPEVIKMLFRGWQWRPELGDFDGPYLNTGKKPS